MQRKQHSERKTVTCTSILVDIGSLFNTKSGGQISEPWILAVFQGMLAHRTASEGSITDVKESSVVDSKRHDLAVHLLSLPRFKISVMLSNISNQSLKLMLFILYLYLLLK